MENNRNQVIIRTSIIGILTGVGVYSTNTSGGEAAQIEEDVRRRVLAHDWAKEMHGFYLDQENRELRFDVVMNFDIRPKEGVRILLEEIRQAYPDYQVEIVPDVDVTD